MRPRSQAVAVAATTAVSVLLSGSASAQTKPAPVPTSIPLAPPGSPTGGPQGWQNTSGNGVTVGAQSGTASPGSAGSTGGSSGGDGGTSNCTWIPNGGQDTLSGFDAAGNIISGGGGRDSAGNVIQPGIPGAWYVQICGGHLVALFFVPDGAAPPARIVKSPMMLAAQARSHLTAAAPQVQMSPASTTDGPGTPLASAHWQYVNVPAWVWLWPAHWKPLHATATVPGVSVTATATPAQLVLSYQDGIGGTRQVICNGPGTPYSDQLAAAEFTAMPDPKPGLTSIVAPSPDCGWVWRHSAAESPDEKLEMTAYVVYDLSWTVTGAPGGGKLPPLNSATSTYRVVVGEIQALNIPSPPP
jgi:hypothetical protein